MHGPEHAGDVSPDVVLYTLFRRNRYALLQHAVVRVKTELTPLDTAPCMRAPSTQSWSRTSYKLQA